MASSVTPTGTQLQIATDADFTDIVNTDSGSYRTSQAFVKGDLPFGVDLYARVRHVGAETGTGRWSRVVKFQVAIPKYVIGVYMDNSNTSAKGTFHWIDILGNEVSSFNFQEHPTYAGITCVTADPDRGDPVYLTRFPKFYCKTLASGPIGSDASGKKCWWISSEPEEGFRPHACFKRSTTVDANGKYVVADYCQMGRYLGHSATVGGKTCLGSAPNKTVLASTTKANFKTYITNRNNAGAGITGFRMFDIWDLGALRMLLLIAKANSDTQTVWGDNSAGTSYPKTGSTNARACFQGTHANPTVSMEDLWRCYWYHADLITVNNGVVTLTSPMDLTSTLSFGGATASRYTQPTSSGWIRDVLDCPVVIGNDTHDLMELFLPKTVVSAENQGTFSDYHTGGTYTGTVSLLIGARGTGTNAEDHLCGLFRGHINFDDASTVNSIFGSRLSKN